MQKKEEALHSDDLATPSAGHAILQGKATMLKSGCASIAQIGVRDSKMQHDGAAQKDKPGGEIIGLSGDQLSDALNAMGVPNHQISMRRAQIWRWLYCQGVTDFDDMQNISKSFRQDLADYFILNMPEIVSEQISQDGTIKWLLRFALKGVRQAVEVETVYIPEPERGTLCVSSQAGCTLNCSFCHTGTQSLVRNLTAGEIVAQILYARRRLALRAQELSGQAQELTGQAQELSGQAQEENSSAANSALPITNIVMMGMGEPLYNFDNVKQALDIVADGAAIAVSKRRITLSTAGVVPRIADVGNQIKCLLAISLHAVRDEIRDELVPINRKWPIEALLEACRTFPGVCNARRITFEYVMLKNVNDSLAEARELTRLIRHIPAKVNLIPFNPWPGTRYQTSDWEQIEAFGRIVNDAGYAAPIRMPRGRDIFAACGQLRTDSIRQRLREKIKEES